MGVPVTIGVLSATLDVKSLLSVAINVTFGICKIHAHIMDLCHAARAEGIRSLTLPVNEDGSFYGNDPADGAAEDSFGDILYMICDYYQPCPLYGSVPASAMYHTGLVNWLVTKFTTIFIVTLANIFTVVTVRRLVLHNPS